MMKAMTILATGAALAYLLFLFPWPSNASSEVPISWVLITTAGNHSPEDADPDRRDKVSHVFGVSSQNACSRLLAEVEKGHWYRSAICRQVETSCDWPIGSDGGGLKFAAKDCNKH